MADPIETGQAAATENHHHTTEHPAVLDKTDARQGGPSWLNFRVLVVSLGVCVVVGLALYTILY